MSKMVHGMGLKIKSQVKKIYEIHRAKRDDFCLFEFLLFCSTMSFVVLIVKVNLLTVAVKLAA